MHLLFSCITSYLSNSFTIQSFYQAPPPPTNAVLLLVDNFCTWTQLMEKAHYLYSTSYCKIFIECESWLEIKSYCYVVGLGLNCKFIDLLFKHSFIKFIEISLYLDFIVSEIICKQTDTLNQELIHQRQF